MTQQPSNPPNKWSKVWPTVGITAIIVLAAIGLWLNSKPFQSSQADTFTVTGQIQKIDPENDRLNLIGSLTMSQIKVEKASGKAKGWFKDPAKTKIYNGYARDKSHGDVQTPSRNHLLDAEGHSIEFDELKVGITVRITGSIHANNTMNAVTDRAVIDSLQVTP